MKLFKYLALALAASVVMPAFAQQSNDQLENRYRRLSLCNILIKHPKEKYADEIEAQFLKIPVSEQFNDHNLSVRVISTHEKIKDEDPVTDFVRRNRMGSRMIGKWFNRNMLTGQCDMNLVKERGLYDASAFDRELASQTVLGKAMLEDAGEDLIGNTYLLMHDITYIDKGKRSRMWGAIGGALMAGLTAYAGGNASSIQNSFNSTNALISSYKGFSVKINTRLYRLVWDDEVAGAFYKEHYGVGPDEAKRDKFEEDRANYRMEYIGNVISKGGRTSFLGINEQEPELMIRKACQRAMDSNVADLMKKYEQFRIKTPVVEVSPKITARIGMKEGVTPDSKFEVLEIQEKDGKIKYKRVAVVKPVANKIWDNRFMAVEELAYGANLGATTFTRVSGGEILPGHLLRQID